MYLPEFTKNPLELVTAKHSRIATTALLLPLILTKLRPMIYSVDDQYTQVLCYVRWSRFHNSLQCNFRTLRFYVMHGRFTAEKRYCTGQSFKMSIWVATRNMRSALNNISRKLVQHKLHANLRNYSNFLAVELLGNSYKSKSRTLPSLRESRRQVQAVSIALRWARPTQGTCRTVFLSKCSFSANPVDFHLNATFTHFFLYST